ncbi:MAG: hypothetical protein LRZ85_07850 [Alphaproteobacteria bacterium]|nr:hypothetical protein [Alphaproteobacteria bacterium]MCD8520219.1 hypothetical protein [Alphaproteobacteria bacterium]MCD8525925.1 hypothetical protein [Alphaproteobacteria bacterium]MCD8570450.1 hypothetical protein [Alphaproteobacteria bacterium]
MSAEKPAPEAHGNDSVNDNTKGKAGSSILQRLKTQKEHQEPEVISVDQWIDRCKTDPSAYENFAERLLKAIGEPETIDTKLSDLQTRLVHGGKKITQYAPFKDMYDVEDVISQLVRYLENGAQGMLVLRGPVGSGKTEIATIIEKLMEKVPFYVLKCKTTGKISPFNDSPLCLLSGEELAKDASAELGIPMRYLKEAKSAWVTKRLDHFKGDANAAFDVVKIYPSRERQIGIAKLDPQDPKTADMSALIGSVDRTLVGEEDPFNPDETLKEGDPDAYKPGVFSRSHGGVFHAAEFFRNNPALLNAFLESVTTGYFTGNSGIGMLPMNQLIIITSNDPVWKQFKQANDSDAARNRIEIIDVPYTLRLSEELKIYEKLLAKSKHGEKPVAPGTKELLAEFSVVSRQKDGIGAALKPYDPFLRARIMNGETPDAAEGKIPPLHEIRAKTDPDEGMDGFTIRDAERVLLRTFNARAKEKIQEADTILLLETLRDFITKANTEDISEDEKKRFRGYVDTLAERNRQELEKKINAAIIDADDGTCQRIFDEYLEYADAWVNEKDLFSETGEPIDMTKVERHLQSFEKRAGITNGEQFRQSALASINSEIARIAKKNRGKPRDQQEEVLVRWDSFEPVARAIRAQYEVDQDSRRHILSAKSSADLRTDEEKRQHTRFHKNMHTQGYTDTMIARMLHHLNYT